MRVIKVLVAVMGFLIVAGVALLIYGLQRQKDDTAIADVNRPQAPVAGEKSAAVADKGQNIEIAPFGTLNVDMNKDEKLTGFSVDGGRAYLQIDGPDGARIVLVSLVNKQVLGQILLTQP
jgi:hypothetical protein